MKKKQEGQPRWHLLYDNPTALLYFGSAAFNTNPSSELAALCRTKGLIFSEKCITWGDPDFAYGLSVLQ